MKRILLVRYKRKKYLPRNYSYWCNWCL